MDRIAVIERTRRWITSMVIGLNLCPFAERVFRAGTVRYVVTDAADEEALRAELVDELETLMHSPGVETTLLIHPGVLGSFADYNDFLGVADRLLGTLGLRGTIQIASFHPEYRFAGADADAVENYTNRSPHAMLHLLREARISAAARNPKELQDIPQRNMETLRRLGRERVLEMLRALDAGLG